MAKLSTMANIVASSEEQNAAREARYTENKDRMWA